MSNELTKTTTSKPALMRKAALMLYHPQPGVKAVEIRRALVEVPEVFAGLTNVEKSVFVASTKRQLQEYEDKEELVRNARTLFRYIALDVGYTIPTNTADWQYTQTRLLDVLCTYFPQVTLNAIKMAFELAAVGELDTYLPRDKNGKADKNHYQQFNADYFSKILRAYEQRQSEVIYKAFESIPRPAVGAIENKRATNKFKQKLIYAFLYYKYKGVMCELSDTQEFMCYKLLSNCGLIEAEITEDDLRLSMLEIRKQIATGFIKPFQAGNIRIHGEQHEAVKTGAYKYAQRRALIECFDTMVREEIQITDYIKL